MPRLLIVIASTRPGRAGGLVGEWFVERARGHGARSRTHWIASIGSGGTNPSDSSVTTLKMVPVKEGVIIPVVKTRLADGLFLGDDRLGAAAAEMLDGLERWTLALGSIRREVV